MLGAVLTALAETGSITVVGAMDTDRWADTRARVGGLFGRGRPTRQARVEAQLDEHAALVAEADDPGEARRSLIPLWRQELEALLRRHPDAEPQLRALITQVQDVLPAPQQTWIQENLAPPLP